MCCSSAANVGGRLSKLLDYCVKIELFSGLIDFHNVTNLVWYVKHCKVEIVTTLQENLDSTSAVQVFLHAQEKHCSLDPMPSVVS